MNKWQHQHKQTQVLDKYLKLFPEIIAAKKIINTEQNSDRIWVPHKSLKSEKNKMAECQL